jgi:hypothetical protein
MWVGGWLDGAMSHHAPGANAATRHRHAATA